jgi:FkbM family methyltransferase
MKKVVNSFVFNRILEQNMPNSTIPAWFNETYSQCYEDVIIDSIIRAHIKTNGIPKSVSFIEIGANHPVCTSASYLFKSRYGLNGVLVEANPKLIKALERYRPGDKVINAAVVDQDVESIDFYLSPENEISSLDERFVNAWKDLGVEDKITVPAIRINALLEMLKDVELVLLSIDVEGYDMRLLEDMDFDAYRPFIIQVEPSDGFAPGTSDKMIKFLRDKGYSLVGETDVNLIFKNTIDLPKELSKALSSS